MTQTPPAAWYPDPQGSLQLRWWDGTRWTDHYAPAPGAAPAQQQNSQPPSKLTNKEWWFGRTSQQLEAKERRHTKMDQLRARVSEPQAVQRAAPRAKGRAVPSLAELVAAARLEPPREPLDEQVEVVGETYHVKGVKRTFAEAGMPITEGGSTLEAVQCILAPEPWNPHDPNAVAVMIGQHHVGYIPAEVAEEYAEGLGRLASAGVLTTGEARIWAKDDAGMIRARVTVLIPEAWMFDD